MFAGYSMYLFIVLIQLVITVSIVKAEDPQLEFNYLPIAHVRTDPILSQTCLSDHVHTFYGPPLVRPEITTSDLRASHPSEHSGLVRQNKSLYWHPTIYKYNKDTKTYTIDEIYFTSIFYSWKIGEDTRSFPGGFRMIAKDTKAFTKCVEGTFFECTRSDGCDTENTFFPTSACSLLEVTMNFPSCWNGQDDSADHMSHVTYADENGSCPNTHRRHIPKVTISVHIKDYDGGYHTFSDMTSLFHADYIAGWSRPLMEEFIEGCQTNVENCHTYVDFKNGATVNDSPDQKHNKLIEILPPLPDTLSTISPEPVDNVVGDLPRGTCTGTLIPPEGSPSPPTAPTPTSSPTFSPTESQSCKKNKAPCKKNSDCCDNKCSRKKCKKKKTPKKSPKKTPSNSCAKKKAACKKNSDCCKKKCKNEICKK